MICACLAPWARIERASCSRALVVSVNWVDEGGPPRKAGHGRPNRPVRLIAVEDPDRLAEAHHYRLLGFGHDREAAEQHDEDEKPDDRRQQRPAEDKARHCW